VMSLPTKSQRISGELATDLRKVDKNSVNAENQMLLNGFHSVRQQLVGRHPLEALDSTYGQRLDNQNFLLLKSIQGIQAPLRLIHERRAAQRVQRLPVLNSSNLMLDVLTGKDELIGPEDFLNDVSQPEVMPPIHMLCERYGL